MRSLEDIRHKLEQLRTEDSDLLLVSARTLHSQPESEYRSIAGTESPGIECPGGYKGKGNATQRNASLAPALCGQVQHRQQGTNMINCTGSVPGG